MNSKKNIIRYIIYGILIVLILCVPSVSAHSGKTDSQGGHNSPSGYHYHHGYPAHQHINGTCPYDFDDKTNHKSSGSNKTKKSSDKFTATDTKTSSSSDNIGIISLIVILICFLGPLLAGFVLIIKDKIDNIKDKKEYPKIQAELKKTYNGKIASEIFDFPKKCQINDKGKPIIDGEVAENIFVYISSNGKKYHTGQCRYGRIKISILKLPYGYQPCGICRPKEFSFDWYHRFKGTEEKLKKYNLRMVIRDEKIQILNLDDKIEKASYYMHMDLLDAELVEEAEKAGMFPAQYKEFCRLVVEGHNLAKNNLGGSD